MTYHELNDVDPEMLILHRVEPDTSFTKLRNDLTPRCVLQELNIVLYPASDMTLNPRVVVVLTLISSFDAS